MSGKKINLIFCPGIGMGCLHPCLSAHAPGIALQPGVWTGSSTIIYQQHQPHNSSTNKSLYTHATWPRKVASTSYPLCHASANEWHNPTCLGCCKQCQQHDKASGAATPLDRHVVLRDQKEYQHWLTHAVLDPASLSWLGKM